MLGFPKYIRKSVVLSTGNSITITRGGAYTIKLNAELPSILLDANEVHVVDSAISVSCKCGSYTVRFSVASYGDTIVNGGMITSSAVVVVSSILSGNYDMSDGSYGATFTLTLTLVADIY